MPATVPRARHRRSTTSHGSASSVARCAVTRRLPPVPPGGVAVALEVEGREPERAGREVARHRHHAVVDRELARAYASTRATTSGGSGRSTSAARSITWTPRVRNAALRRASVAPSVGASIGSKSPRSTAWPVMARNRASSRMRWTSVSPPRGATAVARPLAVVSDSANVGGTRSTVTGVGKGVGTTPPTARRPGAFRRPPSPRPRGVTMSLPRIVDRATWLDARTELLTEEKELTRRRDALEHQAPRAAHGRGRHAVRVPRARR